MSFKCIVSAISEQCQEIKQGLGTLPYFETWEADAIAECCRVGSVVEFASDKIILGPGIGSSHTIYFVLEGVCKMVRHLQVEVKKNLRQGTSYKLYKCRDSKTFNSDSTNECYSSRWLSQMGSTKNLDHVEETEDTKTQHAEDQSEKAPVNALAVETSSKKAIKSETEQDEDPEPNYLKQKDGKDAKEMVFQPFHHLKILEECLKRRKETIWVSKNGALPEKPKNVNSLFVQIGFLFKGACFGLDKCQKENFIMSVTKVKCLKIPQRFLLRQKPCYVWDKIQLFHALYLPKDEHVLRYILTDRKWTRETKEISRKIVFSKGIPNYTLISDVPYSVRLSQVL